HAIVALSPFMCRFFFFFQAEDGIRDRNVTGVQTCALPICALRSASQASTVSKSEILCTKASFNSGVCGSSTRFTVTSNTTGCPRSEERRVGKERRSRWRPPHEKEKGAQTCTHNRSQRTRAE